MSGTDVAYDRYWHRSYPVLTYGMLLRDFGTAPRCPILTGDMLLPDGRALEGDDEMEGACAELPTRSLRDARY
eukprot:1756843-Rhodomonas_salina.2